MTASRHPAALAAVLLWSLAAAAWAQTVTLKGPDGQTRTLGLAEMAALPHQSAVLVGEKGPARTYEGVPLTSLLQSVGAPAGPGLRGKALADMVVVTASDGYRVVLSLAETDPAMRPSNIILADRTAGAPLAAPEGPLRLVIEGDLRPARSARMVTAIAVQPAP